MSNHNAFAGKRVRQNSEKIKQMRKRDRRLRNLGLSILVFEQPINWLSYFQIRNEQRSRLARKAAA